MDENMTAQITTGGVKAPKADGGGRGGLKKMAKKVSGLKDGLKNGKSRVQLRESIEEVEIEVGEVETVKGGCCLGVRPSNVKVGMRRS